MALQINPLSRAKGQSAAECELCGKPAKVACQHCRVTFYCDVAHQACDNRGIHHKICQLLGALRTLRPTLGSEEERRRREMTVAMSEHALIDLCRAEASNFLVKGQYELAIPGGIQALKFALDVHGPGSLELVAPYLLIAEANLGLARYSVAEEFLLHARWAVAKAPACSNELKAHLARSFGKLYAAGERYDDAIRQLALDAYHLSLEHGPEHVDVGVSYYYIGDVFLLKANVESALAFFDKTVEIMFKFCAKLRERQGETISDYLDEAQVGEICDVVRNILATRTKHLGASHVATGEAAFTLAILHHVTGYDGMAKELYEQARDVYCVHFGGDHDLTKAVDAALAEIE